MHGGFEYKERRIGAGGDETKALNEQGEALKPGPRYLLETIQRFMKMADVIREGGIGKA